MKIIECEQGTEAWFKARLGIVTASELHAVMAKGRDGGASVTRKSYMYRLAAEIISGEPAETYSNSHMERGKVMEEQAREHYSFVTGHELHRVGFVHNEKTNCGCSPDSLIDPEGALEIKTKLPGLVVECILRGEIPPEHKAQTQGVLWIAERDWIDLSVFWPSMPAFIAKAKRDENYIKQLVAGVTQFQNELHDVVERVRKHRS